MSKKFTNLSVFVFPLFKIHIVSELFCYLEIWGRCFSLKNYLENYLFG